MKRREKTVFLIPQGVDVAAETASDPMKPSRSEVEEVSATIMARTGFLPV